MNIGGLYFNPNEINYFTVVRETSLQIRVHFHFKNGDHIHMTVKEDWELQELYNKFK